MMAPDYIGPLRVWIHEAKKKPLASVLFLHGLGEHSARHSNSIERLTQAGFECVRFDFRGCGESRGDRQWIERFEDYVDDAVNIVEWLQTTRKGVPLFLFAHSLGGTVAIHSAARLRGKIRGYVLSAPAYEVGRGVSKVKIVLGRLLNSLLPRLKVPSALDLSALSRESAVCRAYENDPLCAHFSRVRQGNEILRALKQVPERCRGIDAPVLIVHGEKDRLVLAQGSQEIFQRISIKDKKLRLFPEGYHELHNDLDRNEYLNEVVRWMKERLTPQAKG